MARIVDDKGGGYHLGRGLTIAALQRVVRTCRPVRFVQWLAGLDRYTVLLRLAEGTTGCWVLVALTPREWAMVKRWTAGTPEGRTLALAEYKARRRTRRLEEAGREAARLA